MIGKREEGEKQAKDRGKRGRDHRVSDAVVRVYITSEVEAVLRNIAGCVSPVKGGGWASETSER